MKHYFTLFILFFVSIVSSGQTFNCGDTLIDPRDGQKYPTVLVGSDCWFKKNLNYGTYVPSTTLTTIHSQQTNNSIAEKYAQQNNTSNLTTYGGLYEQAELMNYSNSSQGLCPAGWHVSTDQEWQNLITAAGATMLNDSSGILGNGLKATGTGFGSGQGTNLVGVSLLPGGDRDGFGIFYGIGLRYLYWTSTKFGANRAYHYMLYAEKDTIIRLKLGITTTAFSCRCVKDNTTGVNEHSDNNIQVFPNPANSVLNINTGLITGSLVFFNSIGQIVKTYLLSSTQNIMIDVSAWPNGIYQIHLTDLSGVTIATKKIIIN